MTNIILLHVVLAILLFLIQNWVGSRSYSIGYIRFSFLDDKDEALAVNYVIKVFGPIIFLILVVALFQYVGLHQFNEGIINTIYIYIGIRLLLIIVYDRILIVNWFRIIIHYTSIVIVSNLIYNHFLLSIENLLPDFSEIKNEIWLLILIFLYKVFNGFEVNYPANTLQEHRIAYLPELIPRKRRYIIRKFEKFQKKYHNVIDALILKDKEFSVVIYSILIFENFNRPRLVRFVEIFWFKIIKRHTLSTTGIMQTKSTQVLSDKQSIEQGTNYLFQIYQNLKKEEEGRDSHRYSIRRTIKRHCKDRMYIRQILFISKGILDQKYSEHERNTEFNFLYSEIREEFNLYDFY